MFAAFDTAKAVSSLHLSLIFFYTYLSLCLRLFSLASILPFLIDTTLTKNMDKFWEFDFDQFARYDLPACVNYILTASGSPSLTYIGHSQGYVKRTDSLFA